MTDKNEAESRPLQELQGRRRRPAQFEEGESGGELRNQAPPVVHEPRHEAVDLAISHRPELILMDVRMPVMDGLEATRRLREMPQFADLPVIALTATVGPEAVKRCLDAGCTGHLAKPIQSEELFAVLRRYLADDPDPQQT